MQQPKKPAASLVGFGPTVQEQEAKAKEQEQQQAKKSKAKPARNRLHKVFMLTEEQADQLDSYCFHKKTTIQATVLEGLDLVFRSKGLPPLKEEILPKK